MLAHPLQTCSPHDVRVACRERWDAQRAGEFIFVLCGDRSGWAFANARVPLGSPEPPFLFSWCPYCLERLPDLVAMLLRPLTIEDEEGG